MCGETCSLKGKAALAVMGSSPIKSHNKNGR